MRNGVPKRDNINALTCVKNFDSGPRSAPWVSTISMSALGRVRISLPETVSPSGRFSSAPEEVPVGGALEAG